MERSLFCLDCKEVFDNNITYHAKNFCAKCYYRYTRRNKVKVDKPIICGTCNLKYGSVGPKGKVIKKGPKGNCRSCFHKINKAVSICDDCGETMLKKTITRICPVCKIKKNIDAGNRKYKHHIIKPVIIENEEFELIRRLLVRYKLGMNNMADDFRVADVYLTIKDAPEYLDTLNERQQVVEMLRHLKVTFDYNLEERKKPKKNGTYKKTKTKSVSKQ